MVKAPRERGFTLLEIMIVVALVGLHFARNSRMTAAKVQEYVRFLIHEYPGFEKAYLASTASAIGVRETRRLKGEYVLTGEDVRHGAKFEDAIACCSAPIEDHNSGKDAKATGEKSR